jgi:predicted permease
MIHDFFQDLRYGLRSLRRSPGFTAVVVATLALGIGANVAIFSLLDAVLLRGLPVPQPHTLVLLSEGMGRGRGWLPPTRADGRLGMFSQPLYERLRAEPGVFSGLAAQDTMPTGASVRWRGGGGDGPEDRAEAHCVSASFFDVLGVRAALGRTFVPGDETAPGANPVVVLSHAYWQRRFGGDPAVVGGPITLNDRPYTVVGVTAPGFIGAEVTRATDLWVPLTMHPALTGAQSRLDRRDHWWLVVIGRLAPGVPMAAAQARANLVLQQHLAEDPALAGQQDKRRAIHIGLAAGAQGVSNVRRSLQDPLLVLMAGVGLLLLIVCLNVSHLLLARAINRQREMSIRAALGASRARLLRQLFAEGLLLALLGAGAATLLSRWLGDSLLALAQTGGASLARLDVQAGPRLLAVTAGLAAATAVLLGLVPAWQASRWDVQRALGAAATAVAGGGSRRVVTRALIASQVGFSLVLLVGAGLLAQSVGKLRDLDKGFDDQHVLLVELDASRTGLPAAQAPALNDQLVRRLTAQPGVRGASLAAFHVLGGAAQMSLLVDGVTSSRPVEINRVTPGYFDTMGMALRQGRAFTPEDRAGGAAVAVVNEALARQFLGGVDAVGRRFHFDPLKAPEMTRDELTVVGVVRDASTNELRGGPRPTVYLAAAQEPGFLGGLVVRAAGDPALLAEQVRAAVRATHPGLRVRGTIPIRAQIDRSLFRERLLATLSTGFGLAALFLVCLGLYGVIAQWAAQRRREMGVRMALGATSAGLRWLVLRQAFGLVLAGVALGVPAALATSGMLSGLLFGLAPTDPLTLAGAALALFAVAALAAYLPARRTSRIDPMTALRCE